MSGKTPVSVVTKVRAKLSFRVIQSASVFILVVALCLFATFKIDTFFTWENLVGNLLTNAAFLGIMACGMTLVMIAGGFDLSVASITAVCSVVTVLLLGRFESLGVAPAIGLALLVTVGAGVALGSVNGGLISYVGVNPFVVTLSTMLVFRGIALILTQGGQTIMVPLGLGKSVSQIYWGQVAYVDQRIRLVTSPIAGAGGEGYYYLTFPILIFVVAFAVCCYVLHYTRFGHYVYSVGGNENAAWLAGINTSLVKAATYAICGLTCAIAAAIDCGMSNTAQASAHKGFELLVIAAVIVGGTPLGGGSGSLLCTLNGVLLLSVIENLLGQFGVQEEARNIARGFIILVVVTVDVLARRSQRRR